MDIHATCPSLHFEAKKISLGLDRILDLGLSIGSVEAAHIVIANRGKGVAFVKVTVLLFVRYCEGIAGVDFMGIRVDVTAIDQPMVFR